MSVLERIAQRAPPDGGHPPLADLLAETALTALRRADETRARPHIARHFAEILLRDTVVEGEAFVESLLEHGVPMHRIVSVHIPAAARHLGALWEEDTLDFASVTRGCGNLTRIAHDLGWHPPVAAGGFGHKPRALLIRPAEEQHFIGLLVAAYELRAAGWLVRLHLAPERDDLGATLDAESYEMIGVTLAHDRAVEPAARLLEAVRRRAPGTRRVVGGSLLERAPELCDGLDIDFALPPGSDIAARLAPDGDRPSR